MARPSKEEVAAYNKAYQAANREKIAAQRKQYREAHKDELAAGFAARYAANRDEQIAKRKAYRAANRNKVSTQRKARYADPVIRANASARAKKWAKANPERLRAKAHLVRARKAGSEGRYTAEQWIALCSWFGNVCLACGATERLTVDHVIPLKLGGSNYIENIQPLCSKCNVSKRSNTTDYRDPVLLSSFIESLKG